MADLQLRGPAEYPGLPAAIRRDLSGRGCRIPQTSAFADKPDNVVRGHFRSPGQWDWAVLCSRADRSAVIVYWNGDAKNTWVDTESPDRNWMERDGSRWRYTRYIAVASPGKIRRFAHAFGDPAELPQALEHDGLEVGDASKASTILYWQGGKWLELPGMD